jgi:hypothetical protein
MNFIYIAHKAKNAKSKNEKQKCRLNELKMNWNNTQNL